MLNRERKNRFKCNPICPATSIAPAISLSISDFSACDDSKVDDRPRISAKAMRRRVGTEET